MSTKKQAGSRIGGAVGAVRSVLNGTGDPISDLYRHSRTAVVAAHVARERILPPRARSQSDIPANPEGVTSPWLTAVLCRDIPGAEVVWSETVTDSAGSSTRWRTRVRYNEAGTRAGLPTKVYSKTTEAFKQRLMLGFNGILPGEPTFFSEFRPHLEIEAPRAYHSAYDARSWRSISVIEDLSETKGAEFVTPARPISRGEIEDLLTNMATWHGHYWEHPQILGRPGLQTPREYVRRSAHIFALERTAQGGVAMGRDVIPEDVAPRTQEAIRAMWAGLQEATDGPRTLLHGDPHIANTYVTEGGAMGFTDWQIVTQGSWFYDYAYLVNGALAVEDRRAWERDLLGFYLDRLSAFGGKAPDFDEAWMSYRRQAAWPYFAWLLTLGHGAMQPNMQPDALSMEMVRRTSAALSDHGTLDL